MGRDFNDIVKTYGAEVVAIAETEAEARRIAEATPYQDNNPIIGNPNQVAEQVLAQASDQLGPAADT